MKEQAPTELIIFVEVGTMIYQPSRDFPSRIILLCDNRSRKSYLLLHYLFSIVKLDHGFVLIFLLQPTL